MKKKTITALSRWLHTGLLAIFIFNLVAPSPALARPGAQDVGTVTPEASPTAAPDTSSATTTTATASVDATGSPTETPLASPVVTETPTPAAALLSVTLSSVPGYITPSGTVTLKWDIAGDLSSLAAPRLKITLPAEFQPLGQAQGVFDPAAPTLTLAPGSASGQVTLRAQAPPMLATISAQLLDGATPVATDDYPLPAHEEFRLDQHGGELVTFGGRVHVSIPDGVLPGSAVLDAGIRVRVAAPAGWMSGPPFGFNARVAAPHDLPGAGGGPELHQFPAEIYIDVDYSDLDLAGKSELDLMLYYYDTTLQEWVTLPSHADPKTKTLHAYTTHFTVFDVGGNNFQASHLPSVDAFQVSQFTGAGSYSLPIEVPAGPGGLQPNLSLNYNSQVIDQSTTQTQASWVGMGWSLETGSIERNTRGTTTDYYGPGDVFHGVVEDDTFMLNVAGVTTTIVKYGSNYYAADENFMKFSFDPTADTWTVWDKVGNIYYFEKTTALKLDICQGSAVSQTYRWSLTRMRNIFGKELTYTYTDETKMIGVTYHDDHGTPNDYSDDTCPGAPMASAVTATYPSTIVYPNGRYRVRFELENRADFPAGWPTAYAYHTFPRQRPTTIYLERYDDGNWASGSTIIRKYVFSYAANTSGNLVWPGVGASTRKISTLTQVQQYGQGGSTALPATTFIYGDDMHLTQADNGYGGSVTFDYTPHVYPTHRRASHKKY